MTPAQKRARNWARKMLRLSKQHGLLTPAFKVGVRKYVKGLEARKRRKTRHKGSR